MSGLRLVVFDATQQKRPPRALGYSWRYGTQLYGALGRHDGAFGARDFAEAFAWLNGYQPEQQIQELQFWGHGKWGQILIDRQPLGRELFEPSHALNPAFQGFRERLAPDALIWFRTCETLGAQPGQDFASALSDVTGARVAGHTFVIGFFQSGLHCLRPGMAAHWSSSEGIARGSPEAPEAAHGSSPWAPNTITCLTGAIPVDF
jgi:hypothetical protein